MRQKHCPREAKGRRLRRAKLAKRCAPIGRGISGYKNGIRRYAADELERSAEECGAAPRRDLQPAAAHFDTAMDQETPLHRNGHSLTRAALDLPKAFIFCHGKPEEASRLRCFDDFPHPNQISTVLEVSQINCVGSAKCS
jgi:hypothetical protein